MAQAQRDWYGRLTGIGISLATRMGVFGELPGDAQSITLDGSLGPIRSLGNGPVYVIQPGDGRTSGTNLFHSFNRFNLNQGEQANFQSPAAIQNILVRVTGGSASSIDGVLSTNNSNANLFLLNPAGILLGRNARLQIGGSFIASTADSFVFADGTQFSAIAPQASPLLSISTPIGLQFGHQPGRIQVLGNGRGIRRNTDPVITPNQAALRVPSNRTLVLLGGPLEIVGGTLKTAGGRIELGSVAGAGFVGLSPVDRGFAVNYGQITNFGDMHLSSVAAIDITTRHLSVTRGARISASNTGTGFGTGGDIWIQATAKTTH